VVGGFQAQLAPIRPMYRDGRTHFRNR
jgi:hypothetical protein